MDHQCDKEEMLLEMHGDLKTLVAEFRAMNGQLRDTKHRFDKHDDDSMGFRHKVDTVWTVVHTLKWLCGSALVIYLINRFF